MRYFGRSSNCTLAFCGFVVGACVLVGVGVYRYYNRPPAQTQTPNAPVADSKEESNAQE
tara:strand:- start:558 stop:734 length:177 start_codon:yes stop_codon:yes gene_type:complete